MYADGLGNLQGKVYTVVTPNMTYLLFSDAGMLPSAPLSFDVSDTGIPGRFDITAAIDSADLPSSEDDISAFIVEVETENEALYVLQVQVVYYVHLHYDRLMSK